MSLLNDKGELPKGIEILVKQILKWLNLDPNLVLGRIAAIHDLLAAHDAQQKEIIERLDRIEKQNG